MKKVLLIVACLFLIGCGNVKLINGENAAISFKDGEGISSDEVYNELKKTYGQELVLDLIDTYLLEKEYDTTTDEKNYIKEVKNSMKEYAEKSETDFLAYIKQAYGLNSEDGFDKFVSLNYRRNLWSTDWTKSQVSDKQINQYYDDYAIGDIEASHILISTKATSDMTDDEKDNLDSEALKKANDIIKKLNAGEDFHELAKEYSDDASNASSGGELGYFNRGEMVSAFEEAAISLEIGKYSTTPVKTEYGYHIIYKSDQKEKPELQEIKDSIIETIASEMLQTDSTLYARSLVALREKYEMSIKDSVLNDAYKDLVGE